MATPENAAAFRGQNYSDIRRSLLVNQKLFDDDVFPAVTQSLYYEDSFKEELQLESEIEWLRPGVSFSHYCHCHFQ